MKKKVLMNNDEMKKMLLSSCEAKKVVGGTNSTNKNTDVEIKIVVPIGTN